MKVYRDIFNDIVSLENLFLAWDSFKSGKQKRKDVQLFEWQLEDNIFKLHRDLKYYKYEHGDYTSFYIQDPKQRHIHKASVRDRVLHHAIFTILNPIFESTFISNSFSCRVDKGTHKGINVLDKMIRQVSSNSFKQCFVLKCDVKKFFDTIDHRILLKIISMRVKDEDAIWILEQIIGSLSSESTTIFKKKGLPIGNLTSQLFANIYLNELDQFIKHELRIKNYIRYTDDFVIVSDNELYLKNLINSIRSFLSDELGLELHPKKTNISKSHRGVDFLGYIVLPHYRLLRTKTKQRIFRKLKERVRDYNNGTITKQTLNQSFQSYLGVMSHTNAYNLEQELKNQFWFDYSSHGT